MGLFSKKKKLEKCTEPLIATQISLGSLNTSEITSEELHTILDGEIMILPHPDNTMKNMTYNFTNPNTNNDISLVITSAIPSQKYSMQQYLITKDTVLDFQGELEFKN